MTDEVEVGAYYKWGNRNVIVMVLEVIGDAENGGMVYVDQLGERTPIGMQFFLNRYTRLNDVPELLDAKENKGRQ